MKEIARNGGNLCGQIELGGVKAAARSGGSCSGGRELGSSLSPTHPSIMSNGIIRSPIHRVVVNEVKDRFTVAMFLTPNPDKEIGPIEQLVTESRPKSYKPVKNYPDIFFQYYQKGRRPIEASKIQLCEHE
ncbi:hypothetical protein PIB30_051269 [Stylosanthes scabra]|uniref:Isopenicillin N synthase-like Fe(2+) 2OG dioxygenase domain-containing protein n=1 Tax=Stylosanthes scabra TaxID=79078 RepID=A0ABU6SHP4_9FABA|nr:hypothetical protein [Stylosanthes scabra]